MGVFGGMGKLQTKGQIPPATCFIVVLICMEKSLFFLQFFF